MFCASPSTWIPQRSSYCPTSRLGIHLIWTVFCVRRVRDENIKKTLFFSPWLIILESTLENHSGIQALCVVEHMDSVKVFLTFLLFVLAFIYSLRFLTNIDDLSVRLEAVLTQEKRRNWQHEPLSHNAWPLLVVTGLDAAKTSVNFCWAKLILIWGSPQSCKGF